MAKPQQPDPTQIALGEAQSLLQLWLKVKAFLIKSQSEQPVSPEEEQIFLETKSDVSRMQRLLATKVPTDIGYGADKITDLLKQSISINHLRALPKNDRTTLMNNWHAAFVLISRAVGALQFISEGYTHVAKVKGASGNISEMKKAAATQTEEKGGLLKSPLVYVIVIAAAAAGYYFFFMQ